MIDTIVLRVHDLRLHYQLVKIINRDFKSKYDKMSAQVSRKEAEKFTEPYFTDDVMMINYFRIEGKGTCRLQYSSLEKLNNSGHYLLNAFINKEQDFIEFNFSVPKFVFGTNVLMYVPHIGDKDFTFFNNSSLKFNLSISYERLLGFIKHFFKSEFPEEPNLNAKYIELHRIDLCYNQMFQTKQKALEYLELQKTFQRKHTRISSNKYREYESSFMYFNDRYSLKIYHKGTEYAKRDLKEHKKINVVNAEQIFDIQSLQNFSDRMLRYEITFRKSMLSYLYTLHIFRRNCPHHKSIMKSYKDVESIKSYNDRLGQKLAKMKKEETKNRYLARFPYRRIPDQDKRNHKYIQKLMYKQKTFMLSIEEETNQFNRVTARYSHFEPRALFSKSLFTECANFFLDFIKEFEVTEKPAYQTVSDLIDKYNEENFNKLPKREMLKFMMLLESKTFDEIKKSNIYSRATYYRYKRRFKTIGITQNNILPSSEIKANYDLEDYHSTLHRNKSYVPKGRSLH